MIPSTPSGAVAWVCLLLGLVACIPAVNRRLARVLFETPQRSYCIGIGVTCFVLSVGYVQHYLGGDPRIIDATSYLLQAKIFATGKFAFAPPGALHSFAGRFLVVTPDGELSVLFPPGFAALLALGVALGVPLLVNPLVGALVALLTYRLGAQWFCERSGRAAGVLSTLCVCLRYHSADTMSHAWTAALVLGVLLAASSTSVWRFAPFVAGMCGGWLFATRPVTGALFGLLGLVLVCRDPQVGGRWRVAMTYVVGAMPGLALWWSYQWFTTGSAWMTTQSLYYARSDWPPGCFRLGLGRDVGCRFEHGDFLQRFQPDGFGLVEALQVTLRRLSHHLRDVTNVPCLALVAVYPVVKHSFAQGRSVLLLCAALAHIATYALFYFDGNYPGGGARLFADIVPLEHVLVGLAFVYARCERLLPSLCLVGFAFWGAAEHRTLAAREGGRPMFEADVVHALGVQNALVFVSTDHGFNLGFDPGATPQKGLQVARLRNDGFDHATWQALGRPSAFTYHFDSSASGQAVVTLSPFVPPNSLHFSGRSLWPAAITSGATIPVHNPDGLRLIPQAALRVGVELPVSRDAYYDLHIELQTPSPSTLVVTGWTPHADTPSSTQTATQERPLGNTTIVSFGPKLLRAGKTAVELGSSDEMTVLGLSLAPLQSRHEP